MNNELISRLKYALIPAVILAVFAVYPQISQWAAQGENYQGAYFVANYDEVAYSAYVNAIAEGKPRKYDPFVAKTEEHESIYSIQFVPAYLIAVPARALGVSTSTAFIVLILLIAAASGFAVFFLLSELTDDPRLAAAGTLAVLCLGCAVAYQGELRSMIDGRILIDYFPFMRRYQPGVGFPAFFLFLIFTLRSVRATSLRVCAAYAAAAGSVFAVLIFTYFYLWTAAAGWLACLAVTVAFADRKRLKNTLAAAGVILAFGVAAGIPYWSMLSNRAPNIDAVQLLTVSHAPYLMSPIAVIGIMLFIAFMFLHLRNAGDTDTPTIFGMSFALLPAVLLNQQILTGHSLQPVHYEIFIANYLLLAGIVLLVHRLMRTIAPGHTNNAKILVTIGTFAVIWGFVETTGSVRRGAVTAEIRDSSVNAIRYVAGGSETHHTPVVHANNFVTADYVLTESTARPLWNPHTSSAGGVSIDENRRLFYQYLYYSGFTEKDLADAIQRGNFEVTAAIFGSERALPELGTGSAPITPGEINSEAARYKAYSEAFNTAEAANPGIDHLIVPAEAEPSFANVDRWYDRGAPRDFGMFRVYHLTPKHARQ